MPKKILIPLPENDFDPTETAIPWAILRSHGFEVCFATPGGVRAHCDERMLSGKDLGFLKPMLAANKDARRAYEEMEKSFEFGNPLTWDAIKSNQFGGLILPGGHAPGMRAYLESSVLQNVVVEFFEIDKPVGAICHGVLLAARSARNGVSVLHGRKTTALLASQELLAWALTCGWLGSYYRTYPETVEAEVTRRLRAPSDFISGPLPLTRDNLKNLNRGFTVRDGHYVSARWPGDAHRFALDFIALFTG